jgi:hypothetical protein
MSRYAAMVEGNAESFSDLLGIKFERGRDHLDDLDAAQIRTESGVYALLVYYIRAQKRGMDIHIGKSDDPPRDLREVLKALGDAGSHIIWIDPEIC